MQVLGDLIRLSTESMWLPLPWWQRAPLGLLHGTDVHVGLVKSSRPVGDIIVSTLDIHKWENMLKLECIHAEERGVLALLMEAVLPLNIALAEAVTTETGREHHATLFCEDKGILKVHDALFKIQEVLKRNGFREIKLQPYLARDRLPILASCQTRIDHGWLIAVPFLNWIQEHYDEVSRQVVDLAKAVVSADTENRLLRYVFPLRGARTVKVRHADKPGALRAIFGEFLKCDLNVLSALLRRGGQPAGYAELIVVCEPKPEQNPLEVYERLRDQIRGGAPVYDPAIEFSEGKRAEEVIFLSPPAHRSPAGSRPLYYAQHHAFPSAREAALGKSIRDLLVANRWWLLEPEHVRRQMHDGLPDSCSLMERANAAVILLTGFRRSDDEDFKLRVLHEFGYLRALRKPLLVVIDAEDTTLIDRWINPAHSDCVGLPPDTVSSPGLPNSLIGVVRDWTPRAWPR